MKRISIIVMSVFMIFAMNVSALATTGNSIKNNKSSEFGDAIAKIEEETNSQTQGKLKSTIADWYQINTTMSRDYQSSFSVPPKGDYPFKRKVYLSGGVVFADKVARNVRVIVGSKTFNFVADGSGQLRGSVEVSTEMPIRFEIIGLSGNPIAGVVLNAYTLD